MQTIKNFLLIAVITIGIMEITNIPVLTDSSGQALELLVKSIIALLAALITALLRRLYTRLVKNKLTQKNDQTKTN